MAVVLPAIPMPHGFSDHELCGAINMALLL
jgi:hypothetical protein